MDCTFLFSVYIVLVSNTENIIQYDLVGLASKDEAKELFAPMIEQFQNIDGLTHK